MADTCTDSIVTEMSDRAGAKRSDPRRPGSGVRQMEVFGVCVCGEQAPPRSRTQGANASSALDTCGHPRAVHWHGADRNQACHHSGHTLVGSFFPGFLLGWKEEEEVTPVLFPKSINNLSQN